MSPAGGEGLRLLSGMLTVEPGTGREGGAHAAPPRSFRSELLHLHRVLAAGPGVQLVLGWWILG